MRASEMNPGGALLLIAGALWLPVGVGSVGAAEQPIAFNHRIHVAKGFECSLCHQFVREQRFAGLPTLQTCLLCHSTQISQNPEEAKVRALAERKEPLRWTRITEVHPGDAAYFSHRRHVAQGQIPCATCHGPVAEMTRPPERPPIRITMGFCTACHAQRQVRTDCLACHR